MASVVRNRSLCLLPSSHLPLLRRSSSTTTRRADAALNFDNIKTYAFREKTRDGQPLNKCKKRRQKKVASITDHRSPRNSNDNVLPFAPSLKLENRELDILPWPPSFQQKRQLSDRRRSNINETPYVGSDGRPIDREDWSNEKEDFIDAYKKYYAHHKASPLSEIEFVDTRKPINQATDAIGGEDMGRGVMVEETVDQALARAEAIFRTRAMMGDPCSPHSTVLQRMLRQSSDGSVNA